MKYNFSEDLKSIRGILNITQSEIAEALGVEQITISRNESGVTQPSDKLLESFYRFSFEKGIKLNALKEMLWKENIHRNHRLLFHGAKSEIAGDIDISVGRANNDFGQGFYAGESYSQAVSFVSNFDASSVYILDFDSTDLRGKQFSVNQDWMLTIAYYRGRLRSYEHNDIIKNLILESRDCDYIVAPIADNRMFHIINSFIDGEITDEQCKHCLAATNLGMQYVFTSEKAAKQLKIVERCYVANNEKDFYKNIRSSDAKLGDDKVKLARIQYRGKGRYIDEILV